MRLRGEMAIPQFRILILVCFALLLPSCDETPSKAQNPGASKSRQMGFEASISGSYEGKVTGSGVLKFLPNAGFKKQGYFFLADSQGVRPFGVTFVLPRGLRPGKHTLKSPSPFDIGSVPSVRVDRDMGKSVVSADKNTSGFLNLTAFPNDETKLIGSDVRGNFEFETKNKKGEKISVKGQFTFKVR
jgi:hypothetical protein